MNRSKFTAALLALTLGVSAVSTGAQARDRDDDRDGRHGRHENRHDDRRGPGRHDDRDHGRPSYNPHRGPPPHAHGGPPPRHWQRGQYLPPTYRARTYVIDDWRGHHLRQPPRGHRWVQVGADYVLIAIATGLIAQVILSQ
jgi:Ni/Co efflux regulator RcnB